MLSGAQSMDFTDRVQNTFRELLAYDIQIRTVEDEIHAKLIITDKSLVVSSINLNKMNLGFKMTTNYWREDTESISVCRSPEIILDAKTKYLNVFNNSIDIENVLAGKVEKLVGTMFTSIFNLRSRSEVKKLFAQLIIKEEIKAKKVILKIGKITSKLMQKFNKNIVDKDDFFSSLILYYLTERKHDFDQLNEKLSLFSDEK